MTAAGRDELGPVRDWLLARAHRDAERRLAAARAEAAAIIGQARRSASQAIAAARADGTARGTAAAAAEHARTRARAVAIELAARREVMDALREQVRSAAGRLRDEPGYAVLLAGLSRMAARAAGPAATVTTDAAGGAVARSGQLTVDCSLPRLADLAIEALDGRVRELWTP